MSYSRCLSLSALLASTFITPVAAMDLTPMSPDNNAILEYTHTYTPVPEPASLANSYKTASICFLGVGDCDPNIGFGKADEDYTIDTVAQCKNEGFTLNNCNSVQVPTGYCPYNSSYVKGCKCTSNLVSCPAGQVGVGEACSGQYASCKCDPALVSCPANKNGTGASCSGKYQSCVCKSEYIYNSSNCTSPRSVSGASCDGKYTGCSCPSGITNLPYGCEEYYGSPCTSVCKKAYADNCRNRTAVSTPYGCVTYYADCASKCQTAYTDNCRNRTAANCTYGCQVNWGDCSTKCQTCYPDNCRNRTAVIASCPANATCSYFSDCSSKIQSWSCNSGYTKSGSGCVEICSLRTDRAPCAYGCQSSYSDCPSKCQACYSDNCRNRTAVIASCPANATCSYFSDCSSKISSWSCNSGYKQEGSSCVVARPSCNIGDIFYTDNTCSSDLVSGKTVLGIVVHNNNGGVGGQIMAPWPINTNGYQIHSNSATMKWSAEYVDISSLPNFTSQSSASTDYDSCGNTDKIVAQGSAGTYPAAWAARRYAPTTDTAGKWCLPAAGIMTNIYNYRGTIQDAISKAGGVSYPNCCDWSSSEKSSNHAWSSNLGYSYGLYTNDGKDYNKNVRPVLEF